METTIEDLFPDELKGEALPYFIYWLINKVLLLEIDTQGAMNVKSKVPEGVFIYLVPPSMAELERRIRGRGTETEESLARRLGAAAAEIEIGKRYDYVVVNDTVEQAMEAFEVIRKAERCAVNRNMELLDSMK